MSRLSEEDTMGLAENFFSRIEKHPDGCWLWTGAIQGKQHCILSYCGTRIYAQRWSYIYHRGDIPDGHIIERICQNRLCVNPNHLDALPQSECLHKGKDAHLAQVVQQYKDEQGEIVHIDENCSCEGKICFQCQRFLCVNAFTYLSRTTGQRITRCRQCRNVTRRAAYNAPDSHERQYAKEYREIRREYLRELNKQWRMSNADYDRQRQKTYRQANLDRLREKDRQNQRKRRQTEAYKDYQQQSHVKARSKEYSKRYRDCHPEKVKESNKRWRRNNADYNRIRQHRYKEQAKKAHRRWCELHRANRVASQARRRASKKQSGGSFTAQEWESLKAQYNFTCLCCGRNEPDIKLEAEHVMPVFWFGSSSIKNIQPLCHTCNARKGVMPIDYRPPHLKRRTKRRKTTR